MNHLVYITYGENKGNVYKTQVVELLNSWIKYDNWKITLIQIAKDESFEGLDEKINRVFIKRTHKLLLNSDIELYCKRIINTNSLKNFDDIYFNARGCFAYNIGLFLINKYDISHKVNNLDVRGISEELKYSMSRMILYSYIDKLYMNTIQKATSITTVSENLKTYLFKKYSLNEKNIKIKVIPTLSIMNYKETNDAKKNLAYVGKIAWIKKVDFIKNMYKIEELFEENDWKISIIGATKKIKFFNSKKIAYVDRMTPNELYSFLISFHSGIVLRDDSIVNKVASPCKISDYLCLGIPIIFSGEIGSVKDFLSLYPENIKYCVRLSDLEKDNNALRNFIDISEHERKVLSDKAKNYFGINSVVNKYIDYFMK